MRVLNDFRVSRLGVRYTLGYAIGSPEEAALAFALSAKALEGVSSWGVADADWNGTASQLARRSSIEVGNLERNVLGRLGAPEAEEAARQLHTSWKDQLDLAEWALKNPPGWWDQARAKISQFISDFKSGAAAGWQESVELATSSAPYVLESYWNSASKVGILNEDLVAARASGQVQEEPLNVQASKLAQAESKIETIRDLYSRMSGGGSIDELAQKEYGPYRLSAGWVPPIVFVVALGGLVLSLGLLVGDIKGFTKETADKLAQVAKDPTTQRVVMVIAVVALAAILAPYLLKD